MILSGRDLQLYIDIGKLSITPVRCDQFQQNGVDLVLESALRKSTHFWLGSTKETLSLPDDLMAFVELRSTWARKGFMLPPTIVDAGFVGNLTLEIINMMDSPDDSDLPIGQPFAHLIFAKTTSPCVSYKGKYQGQHGITEAKS